MSEFKSAFPTVPQFPPADKYWKVSTGFNIISIQTPNSPHPHLSLSLSLDIALSL